MTITVESILEQARKLSPNDRARLRDALNEDAPFAYPAISPEVLKMLEGKTVDDFIVKPNLSREEVLERLRSLNVDQPEIDEEGDATWDEVLQSVARNRMSLRTHFPELDDTP
jgi:hypothetical protein